MHIKTKLVLTAVASLGLAGCAPSYEDPRLTVADAWLRSDIVAAGCAEPWAAESPLRDDLELGQPEPDFLGDDGLERWKVRAKGEGYDRLVIVVEHDDGRFCVVTDSTAR